MAQMWKWNLSQLITCWLSRALSRLLRDDWYEMVALGSDPLSPAGLRPSQFSSCRTTGTVLGTLGPLQEAKARFSYDAFFAGHFLTLLARLGEANGDGLLSTLDLASASNFWTPIHMQPRLRATALRFGTRREVAMAKQKDITGRDRYLMLQALSFTIEAFGGRCVRTTTTPR
jgi:hypothetical protein